MFVTNSGKLKEEFFPAMYFDSSVLIDYWMTEGLEIERPESPVEEIVRRNEPEYFEIARGILESEKRIEKVIEVRKKLLFDEVRVTAVISPLCLIELVEWNAEAAFKQIAADASSARAIQRKSKKEIGHYLKRVLQLREDEAEKRQGKRRRESTGLETLMIETWLNRSFAECHGLERLLQADIVNFELTVNRVWQEPSAYAYLQLGISDIMHILIAQHLGCEYLASFDSDFQRAADIIAQETGITVLSSPEEILHVL